MKWLKPGRNNREERINFVEYRAHYVRTHPCKEWSRQQKVLINSIIQSARSVRLTPRQYLGIKGEVCRRQAAQVVSLARISVRYLGLM
ncbi:hypothetical protein HYX10_03520 [Candidatus Woesearchaeota archaeon]|nr:hypothetical protein [Candidatus Woesearchaeota archaeon]